MPDKPKVWNKRDKNCPKDAVYVGRPSKWGNPFKIDKNNSREKVIELYKLYAKSKLVFEHNWLGELRGKDLVCWCAPLPCHADVLLELANKEVEYCEDCGDGDPHTPKCDNCEFTEEA